MTPDTIDLVKLFAAKFGVTIEYLWPLLVSYTRWINIAWFSVDVLWVALSIFLWSKCIPLFFRHVHIYNNRNDAEYQDYNLNITYMVVTAVATVVFGFVAIFAIGDMPGRLAGIMVPEAKSILDLMTQIKK